MYSLLRFLKVPECQDKTWWKQNVDPSGDYSALKVRPSGFINGLCTYLTFLITLQKLLETLLLRRPKDFVIAGKPIVDLPPLTISEVKLVRTVFARSRSSRDLMNASRTSLRAIGQSMTIFSRPQQNDSLNTTARFVERLCPASLVFN